MHALVKKNSLLFSEGVYRRTYERYKFAQFFQKINHIGYSFFFIAKAPVLATRRLDIGRTRRS